MMCNFEKKQPDGSEQVCARELGHSGACAFVPPAMRASGYNHDEHMRAFDRSRLLSMLVAFVAGVLAALLAGCGRVNYEPVDDDAGVSSSALLGSWQRSDGACELSMVFDDAGVVTLERACDDGCTFHLQGGYVVDGDVLRFDLTIDGVAVVPGTSPWHVDEPELELGGATWQRVGDAGELAGVCQ